MIKDVIIHMIPKRFDRHFAREAPDHCKPLLTMVARETALIE